MTIYIEYVLIDNFLIDYMLLKATFFTTGIAVKKRRLFLCAFLGALVALFYPVLREYYILQTLFKIVSGILIVLLSAKFKNKKAFFINALLFFTYTFITGGAIIGIYNLFNIDYAKEFSIAIMFLPVYVLLKGIREVFLYLYKRKNIMSLTVKTEIAYANKKLILNGFYDTGNGVYNGNSPVIFCEKEIFFKLLEEKLLKAKLEKIFINTVSGKTENLAVKLDSVKIYNRDELNIYNNVTLCAINKVGDDYELILHPALMEESQNEDDRKIKKIS